MDELQRESDTHALKPIAHHPETGELAESRLRRSAYPALQRLSCDFRAGVLTLRGRLPSYYLKQVALAVVATVDGVEHIVDQTEVTAPAAGRNRTTMFG
jgi:osmotically-inducible protein OsmY